MSGSHEARRWRGGRSVPIAALLAAFVAGLLVGCGAGDTLPPLHVPPPARCPPIDTYLSELDAAAERGELEGLASVLRNKVPEDVRRDFIDGVLRLLKAFERGAISALASESDEVISEAEGGVQKTLAKVLRWLVAPEPRQDAFALVQRIVATCEGGPALGLLAKVIADEPFVDALLRLLSDPALGETLANLSFDARQGREALQYLVRNLLLAAASPTFRVETITDLLGFFVNLDAPPWDNLRSGLTAALDADGLPVAQALLACVGRVDPELVLGATLHDLLTSNILGDLLTLLPATSDAPDDSPSALVAVLRQVLSFLADDALTRRSLATTLIFILNPDDAPPALASAANLLDAGALDGVLDLVLDLVTGACRR